MRLYYKWLISTRKRLDLTGWHWHWHPGHRVWWNYISCTRGSFWRQKWVKLPFLEIRFPISLGKKGWESWYYIWTRKKPYEIAMYLYIPRNCPWKTVNIVSAVTIQTPPLLSKSGQCKIELNQQHLPPWLAFESTVGPTLMLDLGGSMLEVDDSRDLLDTIRYISTHVISIQS